MVQYSVKKSRGRKIKKYRKSRRGKGRGKRSLKGGKTRRYKVLKNTRRHTLGKRKGKGRGRRMMGGVFGKELGPWSDHHRFRLQNYINAKYKDKFQAAGVPCDYFEEIVCIEPKSDALGMFTNRSRGRFLREENKLQQLLIYSCHASSGGLILCYALVRVPFVTHLYETAQRDGSNEDPLTDAEKSKIPILGMNPKILFIVPGISNVNNTDVDAKTLKKNVDSFYIKRREILIKRAEIDYAGYPLIIKEEVDKFKNLPAGVPGHFGSYEFTSVISSDGDRYRVITNKNSPLGRLLEKIITDQKALPHIPVAIVDPGHRVVYEHSVNNDDPVVDEHSVNNDDPGVDNELVNQ